MEWNFEFLYKNKEEFYNDLKRVGEITESINKLKGTLNTFEGFKAYVLANKELSKVIEHAYVYASMKRDEDQRNEESVKDFSKVYSIYSNAIQSLAWTSPELLTVGLDKLKDFANKEEDLKPALVDINNLYRLNKYVLDEKSEGILANADEAFGKFNELYDKLCVVDAKPSKVKVSTGEVLSIGGNNYTYYLSKLSNQKDRKKVFEAYFKKFEDSAATLAGIYDGILSSDLANTKSRGYKTMLDSHLFSSNIPTDVYKTLVNTTRSHTKPLKRYIKLRKEYLGLKSYHTYDRFESFAKGGKEYSYEEAKKLVLEADKSMGTDFYNKACKVLEDGRVSVYPKEGKRTGAYSTSTYEQGPFILLNHNGKLDDVFTVAHEGGHSIHTLYSNESQPIETASYRIFVAEIASTLNEQVLLDYLLKNIKDKNEKIILLQHAIDSLVATYYRQTLFADFELQSHALKENGEAITANALSNIMADLYKKYYGINLDREPLKKYVWAYIPHLFHTPFYVYQYATSMAASLAIYTKIKSGDKEAFDKYIELLRSGNSDYPVELVKKAGVDLTKKDPYLSLINRIDELVSELEELLK